jgi:hypothetical protein
VSRWRSCNVRLGQQRAFCDDLAKDGIITLLKNDQYVVLVSAILAIEPLEECVWKYYAKNAQTMSDMTGKIETANNLTHILC